jgi:hypothetical protein
MEKVVPSTQWKACCGPAGTVVIADASSVFHHGKVPKSERTAIFLKYVSRQPKRPEACTSRFSQAELLSLSSQRLSKRQKECVLWTPELMAAYQQHEVADIPQNAVLQMSES